MLEGFRPLVLIGHSGVGKSSCLRTLGIADSADMDCEFADPDSTSLDETLDWLGRRLATDRIVALSTHEKMLRALTWAKQGEKYREQLQAWCFMYLRASKSQLRTRLLRPTATGEPRSPAGRRYVLQRYYELDGLFTRLADCSIDCSGQSIEVIADQIDRQAPAPQFGMQRRYA